MSASVSRLLPMNRAAAIFLFCGGTGDGAGAGVVLAGLAAGVAVRVVAELAEDPSALGSLGRMEAPRVRTPSSDTSCNADRPIRTVTASVTDSASCPYRT
jgi:hypothetical protein